MSATATTLMGAISLHRRQKAGAVFFADYCAFAGRMAAQLIGEGC
jgi:hypothetical protein